MASDEFVDSGLLLRAQADQLVYGDTSCVRCGGPIKVGHGCVLHGTALCCSDMPCSPDRVVGTPGTWNGLTFVPEPLNSDD